MEVAAPLPEPVAAALSGRPAVGAWDQMFPLLTVGEDGDPHVCLLSRTEVEPEEAGIRAVIYGAGTVTNLRRTGRATLVAIDGDAAWYCRLEAGLLLEDGHLLGVRFTHLGARRDSAGVSLQPARFLPTQELVRAEHWERTAALLERLAAPGRSPRVSR